MDSFSTSSSCCSSSSYSNSQTFLAKTIDLYKQPPSKPSISYSKTRALMLIDTPQFKGNLSTETRWETHNLLSYRYWKKKFVKQKSPGSSKKIRRLLLT